jgi:hypothetical protein
LQSEMRYAFTDLIEWLEAPDSRCLYEFIGTNLPYLKINLWPSHLRAFIDVLEVVEVYIRTTRDMTEKQENKKRTPKVLYSH